MITESTTEELLEVTLSVHPWMIDAVTNYIRSHKEIREKLNKTHSDMDLVVELLHHEIIIKKALQNPTQQNPSG